MAAPVLIPTAARDATGAGVKYHIEGELVPVLTVELYGMPVYFEHHILLWKDPSTQIGLKSLSGAFKRIFAGLPIFMTQAAGPGRIAFSRDGCGHVFPIHLGPGQAVDVREHQFLAATDNVDYSFNWVKGVANIFLSGTGLWVDTFRSQGDGIVWLHGYGNVFEIALGPGEQVDVEPGSWIYKDQSVQMETQFQGLKASFFASTGQLFWNRFTGPGRIGIQSMTSPAMGANDNQTQQQQPQGGGLGDVLRLLGS